MVDLVQRRRQPLQKLRLPSSVGATLRVVRGKQPDAEAFLEARDRMADGRGRDRQLLAGSAKAAVRGDGGQNGELGS
jgi:hypothetical protein